MASMQERIHLASRAYSINITAAHTGYVDGGLGIPTARTADGKYDLTIAGSASTYTLTATPVAGSTQTGDGTMTIRSDGMRICSGSPTPVWCRSGTW